MEIIKFDQMPEGMGNIEKNGKLYLFAPVPYRLVIETSATPPAINQTYQCEIINIKRGTGIPTRRAYRQRTHTLIRLLDQTNEPATTTLAEQMALAPKGGEPAKPAKRKDNTRKTLILPTNLWKQIEEVAERDHIKPNKAAIRVMQAGLK